MLGNNSVRLLMVICFQSTLNGMKSEFPELKKVIWYVSITLWIPDNILSINVRLRHQVVNKFYLKALAINDLICLIFPTLFFREPHPRLYFSAPQVNWRQVNTFISIILLLPQSKCAIYFISHKEICRGDSRYKVGNADTAAAAHIIRVADYEVCQWSHLVWSMPMSAPQMYLRQQLLNLYFSLTSDV